MKETTKLIKILNIRVRYEFNSNKFMESSEQSVRDKFKHYMNECKNCSEFCETKRAKELLEETINIIENRYDDYIEFHNVENNVLKITEKTMLTPHKRVKLFDIIGKVEK